MKLNNSFLAKNLVLAALAFAAAFLTSATPAQAATPAMLSDGNTTAFVDVDSNAGMYQWLVDGVNHLNQQWFWFRAGSGAQAPINTISAATWSQSAPNQLHTTYTNAGYSVTIDYSLVGGGSGNADISEGIKIHNSTASSLNFTFYQYSDFNLMNTPGGDQIQMDQSSAYQSKGASQIAEGIIAPGASAFEANTTGGTSSTLYKLANQSNLTLGNTVSASGDVTWAYQWDFTIAAGGDAIIAKDKMINIFSVPEPSAMAFISIGLAGLLLRRRTQA